LATKGKAFVAALFELRKSNHSMRSCHDLTPCGFVIMTSSVLSSGREGYTCVRPANFRDVSDSVESLRKLRLFRAAFPTGSRAFSSDIEAAIVDLRSDQEVEQAQLDALPKTMTRLSIAVLNSKLKIFFALVLEMSWAQRFTALRRMLLGMSPSKALRMSFNELGLFGLNRLLLRHAQSEIATIMDSTLAALEQDANSSVIISCSAGKDRTGLVVALILLCTGVVQEDVTRDYSLSSDLLRRDPHFFSDISDRMEREGLDHRWTESPPTVMEQTLQFLQHEYGGFSNYLTRIGFGKSLQLRLSYELRKQ